MASVKSETFTIADGTVVRITVNGQEFRVEGRRPNPASTVPQPVDRWTLRQELAGVKLMVFGWGMGIVATICVAAVVVLAVK